MTYGRPSQNSSGPAFVINERPTTPDPDPNDGQWIILRTEGSQNGTGRVGPDTAETLAKIEGDASGGQSGNALRLLPGASHIWISGVEIIGQGGSGIVGVGSGSSATVKFSEDSTEAVDLDDYVPDHIVFERTYIHARGDADVAAGIHINGNDIAVVDSYISNIKSIGQESYALKAYNGEGPFHIENNYLEAAGINVFFGGDDPTFEYNDSKDTSDGQKLRNPPPSEAGNVWIPYELTPSDITFTDNFVAKKWSWRGADWSDKNLFETKNAKRVLVQGNVFQNNNKDATSDQDYSWVFKSTDQSIPAGSDLRECYWCQTADVTVKDNVLRHAKGGISILGRASTASSASERVTSRIQFSNNLLYDISRDHGGPGTIIRLTDDFTDVEFSNNTFISENGKAGLSVKGSSLKGNNLSFDNNILPQNDFGAVKVDGQAPGITGLSTAILAADVNDATVNGLSFNNNGIIGIITGDYPSTTTYAQDISAALFVDHQRYDYKLQAGSPFQGRGANLSSLCVVVQCTSPDVGGLDSTGQPTDIPDGDFTPADFDVAIQQIVSGSATDTFDFDGNGIVEILPDMTAYVIQENWMNTFFGDANYDQIVNFADFLILSGSFGNTGSWSLGDTDFDGDIDFADFLALSGNVGWVSE